MQHRDRVFLALSLLALLFSACSSHPASSAPNASEHDSAPAIDKLQIILQAEFDRLGIDPDRVPAQAPQKAENAVFDLAAELIDDDGEGGDPPSIITLTWTERLIADYNQDGMVTGSDLTPIGQNYCFDMSITQVDYEDPTLHGGFEQWPDGNPDDGDSGSANWRLARIDGNGDGYILQYDITPIAIHWEERLTGYRLYRMAPGDGDFFLAGLITADRNNTEPVRYTYDNTIETLGSYSFYVRAWDETSGTEGPASGIITIDTASGAVNQSPISALNVTPDFAGAPAVIIMDATSSYDTDGTITGYVWDFDGDGTADWTSGETVPEESSDGTVTMITPVSDGVVEVTFATGSADWKYPQVKAIDNEDAQGQYAQDKLGISGWSSIALVDNLTDTYSQYYPNMLSIDPATGRYVIASSVTHPDLVSPQEREIALIWQQADGSWVDEIIDAPFWQNGDSQNVLICDFIWDESNQPILLLNCNSGTTFSAWAAQRTSGATWSVNEVVPPEYSAEPSRVTIRGAADTEDGRFSCMLTGRYSDMGHIGGAIDFHNRYCALFYDHGTWSTEYLGVDTAETYNWFTAIQGTTPDDIRILWTADGEYTGGPWWSRWSKTDGLGAGTRMDDAQLSFGLQTRSQEAYTLADGTIVSLWTDSSNANHYKVWLMLTDNDETTAYELVDLSLRPDYECRGASGLYHCSRGSGMFLGITKQSGLVDTKCEHWRLEGNDWLVEIPMPTPEGSLSPSTPGQYSVALKPNGEPVILLEQLYFNHNGVQQSNYLAEHVDPRNQD